MKLRGRFTLALALAALVPIALAAIVTTRVIATSYRKDYDANREAAEKAIHNELNRLVEDFTHVGNALADPKHDFVGNLVLDLVKSGGSPSLEVRNKWREKAKGTMGVAALDVLTITGPDDVVLVSPHLRGELGLTKPEIRERANATKGEPYFVFDKVMTQATLASVLVVEAAHKVVDEDHNVVYMLAGKRVTDALLRSVRRPGLIDARIVTPKGDIVLPPAGDWASLGKGKPIVVPLENAAGDKVAIVEVAVSDRGLDTVLRDITIISAALAVAALAAVVLLGLFVARRTARDLDRLVEGSLAAARGDLDHRVPVRSKDEIGAVANAFNLMMEDLKTSKEKLVIAERIAAWQEIARRLAHEIKNPLTPIQMAMDTLKKSWKKQHPSFDEILEESTTTVLQEADRLKHIVAEFSDFARMPKPEFARIDLNEVVRSGLSLYQGAVPLESKLDAVLPQIDADKNQINQVLLNLVENARDAIGTRDGGRILVSTRRGEANDRAMLIVEDNGPGVPSELKDKVFAPYFTTKLGKGGTGLGLAIVHRIVSDHGGRITISEAGGGGARFSIELPLRNGTALLASRI